MTAFSKKYYRSLQPLIKPAHFERPIDWAAVFGRQAPLELEIGFGNGEYLHRLSLSHNDRDYVGVEIAWASVKRALRRLADPPRSNTRVIRARAETVLEKSFAPESLDLIRALFPVPWPDERHAAKRLFQTDFLNLAANRLKKNGVFQLVTDSELLAHWTMEQAEKSALDFTLSQHQAKMDTKYERKWQGGGQDIFYHLDGKKRLHPQLNHSPEIEIEQMQAFYIDNLDPQNYKPQDYVAEGIVVRFHEFIFDQARKEGLLRTLVVEGNLSQDFYIRLRCDGQRWKVSPAIPSELFPTLGIAKALETAIKAR